jgi:hypothetical protein
MRRLNFLLFKRPEPTSQRSSQMKYLYKILRLFFCPHHWTRVSVESIERSRQGKKLGIVAEVRTFRCRYCGDEKTSKVRFDNE